MPSLGAKYNVSIGMATGEYICCWEDDDISLPWRIEKSVELIGSADYLNPMRSYFLDTVGLHTNHPQGYNHNCSMFRKSAWEAVGGYPEVSGPQDARMDGLMRRKCDTCSNPLPMANWWYIYRWGVSPTHLSSRGKESDLYYDQVGTHPIEEGQFQLSPHWRNDYTKMIADAIGT